MPGQLGERDPRSQQMRALRAGNDLRLAASKVRRALAARTITLAEAIGHPDAGPLTLESLLAAQYRWGPDRTGACIAAVAIDPRKRVRELVPRQRAMIVSEAAKPLGAF